MTFTGLDEYYIEKGREEGLKHGLKQGEEIGFKIGMHHECARIVKLFLDKNQFTPAQIAAFVETSEACLRIIKKGILIK